MPGEIWDPLDSQPQRIHLPKPPELSKRMGPPLEVISIPRDVRPTLTRHRTLEVLRVAAMRR